MNTNKVTLAALAAMTVALGLAVVPAALTSQVFAAQPECPGCEGGGHQTVETTTCTNPGGHVKEGDCPGQSENAEPQVEQTCETVFAGQSTHEKGTECEPAV